jgi:glycosyltransferase involved in cell wall biosynthesis
MTLWFDVEDLITHFQHESRPTGIQRLTFEIYREVWQAAGGSGEVRFCRHGATPAEYFVVDWPALEAAILQATASRQPAKPPPRIAAPAPAALNFKGKIVRYLYPRVAPSIRLPLGALYRAQKEMRLALRALVKAAVILLTSPRARETRLGESAILRLSTERVTFAPQDFFIALGSTWSLINGAAGRFLQQRHGLRFAVLIHDLVPELYPEWASREVLPSYQAWLRDVVPHADAIFAYSRHSAQDLLGRMAEWNQKVPAPVVLPVGHHPPRRAVESAAPFDRPFILFVSTIEVRKNHALLFRVWRRLLSSMPAEQVPYLVFAGKTAWLTDNLLTQIENAGWLDGHVKLIESPAEPELMALYAHCEFTVFPSLYEGWGLPVTESLSFGKTVAASNRAAIPEAGGDFCCYYDPENVGDAYQVIRGMIENPERVRQLEARIAAEFHPPSWADTAAVLLDHLGSTKGQGALPPGPPPKAEPLETIDKALEGLGVRSL